MSLPTVDQVGRKPYTILFNSFVKWVDLFANSEHNKSVIIKPQNSNNSVKECVYGTIDIEQTA